MLNGQTQRLHVHIGAAKGVPAHLVHGAVTPPPSKPKAAAAAAVTRPAKKPAVKRGKK